MLHDPGGGAPNISDGEPVFRGLHGQPPNRSYFAGENDILVDGARADGKALSPC